MSNITLVPRVSEKAIALAERGTYVFEVPAVANKLEVTKAVEAAFKVSVTEVNMLVAKGKVKRFRKVLGHQRDIKKALVTIKKGQTIALFEGSK